MKLGGSLLVSLVNTGSSWATLMGCLHSREMRWCSRRYERLGGWRGRERERIQGRKGEKARESAVIDSRPWLTRCRLDEGEWGEKRACSG